MKQQYVFRVEYKEKWVLVNAHDKYEAVLLAAHTWGLPWTKIAKDCNFIRLQKAEKG